MPTSILDLPTELILEIIHSDDSTDATIAYLGMTCRPLHDICQVLVLERQLPVLRALVRRRYLRIHKNSGPIAMKDEELDDVKEILQASFHTIEYVPVDFTVEEFSSVHGLIFHANAIGHINIKLSDISIYILSQAKKKVWHKALPSLIRVSSEKDMASLTITGLPYERPENSPMPIPQIPSSPGKDYFSIFSLLKDRFFRHKTRSNRQVGAPKRERLPNTGVYFGTPGGLKSFEIHSPHPFYMACFPHTLQALNGGYLTKLSLWNTIVCMHDWGKILPLLFMPLLSEFSVRNSDIAFRDLSPFLLRHSSITHLDLRPFSSPIGPITPPAGFLPRLEVISGNPDYLLGLLSSRRKHLFLPGLLSSQRHLFPNLHSVSLTGHTIKDGALDKILRSLADRKRGTIHLSIELPNDTSLMEWFSKAKSEPSSLDCMKALEIKFRFCLSSEMCDSFFSWVSAFPYIQELDLTWVVPVDPESWTWRLDALWDSCPELQVIKVGVKTYQRPVKAVK